MFQQLKHFSETPAVTNLQSTPGQRATVQTASSHISSRSWSNNSDLAACMNDAKVREASLPT